MQIVPKPKQYSENGRITTLEFNPEMVKIARENIEKAGLSDTIEVVEADAKDYLKEIKEDEGFDFILRIASDS